MRILAVLPFVADDIDPDANDLARWLAHDAAAELSVPGVIEPRLVVDQVEISAAALGEAAAQLAADLALGATLHLEEEKMVLAALLVDARGEVRAEWAETMNLGAAPQVARMLARASLLALGEDASAPPQSVEAEAPADAVKRLARAARRIADGEAEDGLNDLLALAEESPGLEAVRRTLLQSASTALGSDRMPAFFSALERFVEARPDDAEALLTLGDYRAAHFDEPGARELYLDARESAEDLALAGQASGRLAALAENAGRKDEAILHLRNAVKQADESDFYARLGSLLLEKDPAEGVQMLLRATVLAPRDAALHLKLARAIREHGGDPSRALSAAARAAQLAPGEGELADEIRAELESLLSE